VTIPVNAIDSGIRTRGGGDVATATRASISSFVQRGGEDDTEDVSKNGSGDLCKFMCRRSQKDPRK